MDLNIRSNLVSKCLSEIEIRTTTPILGGWPSHVVDINGELIFKFPQHSWAEEQYARETRILAELAPAMSVRVPRIEFDCVVEGEEIGRFIAYRNLRGEQITPDELRPPHRDRLAAQLAQFLSELHRFSVEKTRDAGHSDYDAHGWREFHEKDYRWLRNQAYEMLSPSGQKNMRSL